MSVILAHVWMCVLSLVLLCVCLYACALSVCLRVLVCLCACTCVCVCTCVCTCVCVYMCVENSCLSLIMTPSLWSSPEKIWTPSLNSKASLTSSWFLSIKGTLLSSPSCHLLGKLSSLVLSFRDTAVQASDLASNLPGRCSDWEWLWVTACCECKICSTIDKMGEESWDCWAPGGGLANHSQDVTTFQDLQNKTALTWNQSCNLLTDGWCSQFASWDYKWYSELQSLKSHSWSGHEAWDPFPTGTPDVLWQETSQLCLSLGVGWNPIWWCILWSFYFSFLLMLVS